MMDDFGNPLSPPAKEATVQQGTVDVATPLTAWAGAVADTPLYKSSVRVYADRAITNVDLPAEKESEVRPAMLAYIADSVGAGGKYNPAYIAELEELSSADQKKWIVVGSKYPKALIFQGAKKRWTGKCEDNPNYLDPALRCWSTVHPSGSARRGTTHACTHARPALTPVSSRGGVMAGMILVNPVEMTEAVMYAASKIDEVDGEVDIFVVNGTTEKKVSLADLKAAKINAASVKAPPVPVKENTLLEKKRLAEELEEAQEEIKRLRQMQGAPSQSAIALVASVAATRRDTVA